MSKFLADLIVPRVEDEAAIDPVPSEQEMDRFEREMRSARRPGTAFVAQLRRQGT